MNASKMTLPRLAMIALALTGLARVGTAQIDGDETRKLKAEGSSTTSEYLGAPFVNVPPPGGTVDTGTDEDDGEGTEPAAQMVVVGDPGSTYVAILRVDGAYQVVSGRLPPSGVAIVTLMVPWKEVLPSSRRSLRVTR